MGITIEKENRVVVKTSYGYYTDKWGIDYPFTVELRETRGQKRSIEILWTETSPSNFDDAEIELLEMFG